MCGDEAIGMSHVDERKHTVIRIWMTGLVASLGLLAACGNGSGPAGGTAAAGGMGGTGGVGGMTAAVEQVVYRVENVGLFVVPSDGSRQAQRISQPLIAGGGIETPAISPDGTRVVYVADADTDDVFELYAVNPDGTDFQKLNPALVAGGDVSFDFAISPDGTRVVYRADADTDEVVELYAVNPDGTDFQKLNAPLPVGQVVNDFVVVR